MRHTINPHTFDYDKPEASTPCDAHRSPLLTGWLAPDGRLFPCEPFHHFPTALYVLPREYGITPPGDDTYYVYNLMYDLGFIRITEGCMADMSTTALMTQAQDDAIVVLASRCGWGNRRHNLRYFLMQERGYKRYLMNR